MAEADDIVKAFTQTLSAGKKKKGSSGRAAFNVSESARIQYLQQLASTYISLWGVKPPAGYIERAAAAGFNVFELDAHERAKPAFEKSMRYDEERLSTEATIAQRLGAI